ncbi:MAG: hypothetical protein AAB592_03510 [Patescibacteria group bacterium]
MKHTVIPSVKGQVTIPQQIRDKYSIGKNTPIIVEDKGKGTLTFTVTRIVSIQADDNTSYYEDKGGFGLIFKNGMDPRKLIDAIKKIDG